MRIISGIYKSRKLISPDSYSVRPTGDRAKETLFNMLDNRFDFHGLHCMDLYCGTGNLGLESISRGAGMCLFTDLDVNPVKKNIALLGCEEKCVVYKTDSIQFLKNNSNVKTDIIFADPPYDYEKYSELLKCVSKLNAFFVLEHPADFSGDKIYEQNIVLRKKIGTINFTFFDFKISS